MWQTETKIAAELGKHLVITEFRLFKIQFMVRLLVVLILFSFTLKAQTNYLVTSKADTLYGEVKVLTYDELDRAQINIDKKKKTFTALQVLSLNIEGQVYKPVQYDKSILFMKLLKSGYLSLYAYRLPNQNNYDGRFFMKLDGTTLEVPNLNFKRILSKYLEDCESISYKVKEGELGRKDLDQIIDDYNLCMSNKSSVALSAAVPPVIISNEGTKAIDAILKKAEGEDFQSKKDALDLLRDIKSKVEKNETVPNYLTEGLKSYLSSVPALSDDLEKLLSLLKK